jgi:hypothetical protein
MKLESKFCKREIWGFHSGDYKDVTPYDLVGTNFPYILKPLSCKTAICGSDECDSAKGYDTVGTCINIFQYDVSAHIRIYVCLYISTRLSCTGSRLSQLYFPFLTLWERHWDCEKNGIVPSIQDKPWSYAVVRIWGKIQTISAFTSNQRKPNCVLPLLNLLYIFVFLYMCIVGKR